MATDLDITVKKRGRKRKEPIITGDILSTPTTPNIQIVIEENETNMDEINTSAINTSAINTSAINTSASSPTINHLDMSTLSISNTEKEKENSVSDFKKRGRKPKGGKLIIKNADELPKPAAIVNVILHLKCSLKDLNEYNLQRSKLVTNPLNYNSDIPPDIMSYDEKKTAFSIYANENITPAAQSIDYAYSEPINNKLNARLNNLSANNQNTTVDALCSDCGAKIIECDQNNITDNDNDVNIKDVNQKLKRLKINLYKNAMPEKKSACFWCTYEYDNQACYIPKYEMDGAICGYGSFCRPECAVAYLMKESIDDSTKFERYHLLNQIYSKVYNFKNNIKPAPNPFFLLDKFYGNLSIQEYRKLLNTEHMLLVIDKPLTRILPELHEDTDDFITGIYGGNKGSATQAGGVYKVKRQSEKQQGPSKSSIMRDNFNLSQN